MTLTKRHTGLTKNGAGMHPKQNSSTSRKPAVRANKNPSPKAMILTIAS
jgi:hypothetical protein